MNKLSALNVLENTVDKIEKFLELKESVLENDYVKLFGEGSKVVSLLTKSSSLIMQKKFESFLAGFNFENKPTEQQLLKLERYIDNETKAEFIADTFSKILLSKSSKTCLVMGTILNSLVENNEEIKQEHLIAINALINFFDIDLINYIFICGYLGTEIPKYLLTKEFKEKAIQNHLDDTDVWLTIEKCVSLQIISRYDLLDLNIDEKTPSFSMGEVNHHFQINKAGQYLYKYIQRIV
ncbi:hypothetical protein [Metabacillus fastidiosus]|uniref:hypothetical protein n=1 Tax=Metabacillus fastidiosus TaxID=1458 RepID=UPI000827074F|nr:hypothetical protein [Metabacillus fastidiosus]MED4461847.1 hypothetical protein [Metabacillus fastidiosus]